LHAPVEAFSIDAHRNERREPAPDFDHLPRFEIPQHAFEDPGIERRKLTVACVVITVVGMPVEPELQPFLSA